MAILETSNFDNGRFELPTNSYQEDSLENCIDRVESEYLPRLFGVELYNLFIADLTPSTPQTPQSARFIKLFEPFIDQTDDCYTRSEGMIEMLKGLVYYLYVRDNVTQFTTVGTKKTTSENATNITAHGQDITSRYNEGIQIYKVIQNYMLNVDPNTYPEFKGINERFNHPY